MTCNSNAVQIRKALVSTYDKTDLLPLCQLLVENNVEIIATGNTARYLMERGIEVTPIEAITQFPEILGGRVKTLHPHVFGGILSRRNNQSDMTTLEIEEIDPIDLVIVNLYPFEKTASRIEATRADCIETIDIGGPSLLRAAAKNHDFVTVLSDPSQYKEFLIHFEKEKVTTFAFRKKLAADAFAKTAFYDLSIASYLGEQNLRYGENPHQNAKLLISEKEDIPLAKTPPLAGKELSYNNLLDAHAAILSLRCLMSQSRDGQGFGCTIIKHGTLCGASLHNDLCQAVKNAFATDPISAFGGIVALSSSPDDQTAQFLLSHFLEVIIAPNFSENALDTLKQKKNLRLLEISSMLTAPWPKESARSIFGGMLIQQVDTPENEQAVYALKSQRMPTTQESHDLKLAMALVIPCLSNAIAIVKNGQLLGVGAGQTSRVDAVKIAINKAREHGHVLQGAVLASDGFFPFKDSLLLAQEAGITAIVQPGGSIKDEDVILAANELGLTMVFSGVRHFRH